LTSEAKTDIIKPMSSVEQEINLHRRVVELEEIVKKLQEQLRIAANYRNDDLNTRVEGVQFALGKAATVKARDRGRRR